MQAQTESREPNSEVVWAGGVRQAGCEAGTLSQEHQAAQEPHLQTPVLNMQ